MQGSCCTPLFFFFFQAEDGIRDYKVTGVQTCALPLTLPCPRQFRIAWASPKDSCGFPSVSKTWKTSSPTSTKRCCTSSAVPTYCDGARVIWRGRATVKFARHQEICALDSAPARVRV